MRSPFEITPGQVYDVASARAALGLPKSTLPREIRLGRLRVTRRAGRYFILGEWLLTWLREGEIQKRVRDGQRTVEKFVPAGATIARRTDLES